MPSRTGSPRPAWVGGRLFTNPSAPLREMRALRAQRRVLAVPGIDPCLVRQDVEQPLLDVVDQAGEPRGVLLGVADTARESGVSQLSDVLAACAPAALAAIAAARVTARARARALAGERAPDHDVHASAPQ